MGKAAKTIHTPEPERMLKIGFTGAKLDEFRRVDAASGTFKFRVAIGNKLTDLCKRMKWPMPGDKATLEKFEDKLIGGHLVLKAMDQMTDFEIDLEYKEIKGFEIHRLELEGRKGKGFRRELRFSGIFECPDGAANFEAFMMNSKESKGNLTITFQREQVQENLPLTDEDNQRTLEAVQ